ncbi:hypothetical protein ZEAMMB73_Zm00001d019375 [Zea mays]|uniref:Peptidase A1 domain-containing protein n=1 Tax=Zea mays TaxID=4577 RepID=A0A1D6HX58_MAIZE|nr:hypothetical protein ZEAMMB73_Zm00001d019375 [Zea mays]
MRWRPACLSSLTGLSPSARSLTTSVPPPLGSSRMPTRPSGPLKLTVLMVTVPLAPPTTLFPVRPSASLPTKKYTRFEAQVLALRADPATFTVEPEDSEGFGKWSALFSIDEMKEQIETVLHESPELESFVERLVPSVVDFTLLHVSTVKSTILEVGNIELFELNEVISSFLRIMLFFCILSSAVLPKNEKPITESGDEISYEGAKAKHPISLLLGLRRRSTKLSEKVKEQQEKCSITLGQSSELEKLVVSSPKASTNPLNISLTMEGGSVFPINDPIITITDTISNPMAYCLAAMKSEGVNLIGENFMSGLKVVFDRERNVLGWKNFDCYSVGNSRSNLLVNSNPSCVPPRPALGPNSYTPEATKGASPNGTQVNVLQPSASFSPKLHCNRNVLVAAALLFLLIL